jgi:multiple sugar transport system substrate-binding protein
VVVLSAAAILLAGCQSGTGSEETGTGEAVDDGSTITMWTRSSTADLTQLLVDEYNATHENQVELTVIPFDAYQQKVGAAAGGGQLPDILSSDVVFTPNYASKNLFLDITDRIEALPSGDDLAPAHIAASTLDDRVYGVPHAMDLSAVFYNKKLFEAAGLDPEAPPTSLTELAEDARAIAALGDDTYGFTFGGNCGGCLLFGSWPSVWASGGEVMNEDGTESLLDSPEAASVYQVYRDLYADGTAPADARNENGSTQTTIFEQGKMGMQVLGATQRTTLVESDALEIGVFPIPGADGGSSSFIGGDTISISANSEKADQAWDFISWTLSDEAQVEVVA